MTRSCTLLSKGLWARLEACKPCICDHLWGAHVWARSRMATDTQQAHSLQHNGELRHLSFSTIARSEVSKSIYCSCLSATDNQDLWFLEQKDTLKIIQCNGFQTFFSHKVLLYRHAYRRAIYKTEVREERFGTTMEIHRTSENIRALV